MALAIFFIAVLSVAQILRYFFSYEDFSLLYAAQFPTDSHSIFLYRGIDAYRFIEPLVRVQYPSFGYNPFWYYFVSFTLFLLVLALFYWFVRLIYQPKREISIYATAIMASGYLGIESLTWNVFGGQIHLSLLFFSLLGFIFTVFYLKKHGIVYLILLGGTFVIALYFFQFRSYLLFLWVPLLIFLQRLQMRQSISLKLIGTLGVVLVSLSLVFYKNIQFVAGRIQHVNLDANLFPTFLKNLANLVFPSDIIEPINNAQLLFGLLSLAIFILVPALLLWKKHRLALLSLFFSISTVLSLVIIMLIIAFVGQVPTVWPTSHRFYIVLLPFISGYLAVLLSVLRPRARTFLLVLILVTHIFLSNKVIGDRWESLSRHLKYFYTTITTAVPKIDKPMVLLTTLTRPYPPGPFVSGSDAGSAHFLAGFYGKRFDDFHLATEPLEAVRILLDKNLSPATIYAFDYKRDDIIDETQVVRDILTNGRMITLGNNLIGDEIELANLNISLSVPVFVKVEVAVDLALVKKPPLPVGGKIPVSAQFELLFKQEERRVKMAASSGSESLGEEHSIEKVIDGKYDTTWIPQRWGQNSTSATVDLGQIQGISQIVWSSSRVAPWQFRALSQYEVEISKDGVDFVSVAKVGNAPILKTGEFFTAEFSKKEVRYVRIIINKTHGGWTPAIDEIEVFENNMSQEDLVNYFLIKNTPDLYFPDQSTTLLFYRQILKQEIPVEINWKTDTDGAYPAGQEKVFYVEGLGVSREYIISLPKTGRLIKSIRIKPSGFPAGLIISNIEAWQPSLQEFRTNKSLWNVD